MGCPNCSPIFATRQSDQFEYQEVIVSDGLPRTINFKEKNRRVTKAWTYDRHLHFSWTPDFVCINGPKGTEVQVKFTIGR